MRQLLFYTSVILIKPLYLILCSFSITLKCLTGEEVSLFENHKKIFNLMLFATSSICKQTYPFSEAKD